MSVPSFKGILVLVLGVRTKIVRWTKIICSDERVVGIVYTKNKDSTILLSLIFIFVAQPQSAS